MIRGAEVCLLALLLLAAVGCSHMPVGILGAERVAGEDASETIPVKAETFDAALREASPFRGILHSVSRAVRSGEESKGLHWVSMLDGGEDALLARLHLIEAAKKSIEFQTFIWADDESSRLMADTLLAAARRGVKVRLLVDYMGLTKEPKVVARLARSNANLEVRVYRPTARRLKGGYLGSFLYVLSNFKGANQRMHNKVIVVDDAVAITGGRNVENSYFDHSLSMNFKDRDVLVVGPVAVEMRRAFDGFWNYRHTVTARNLRDVASIQAEEFGDLEVPETAIWRRLQARARWARDGSLVRRRLVEPMHRVRSVVFVADLPGKNAAVHLSGGGHATNRVVQALTRAERELWIQSPYLVLGRSGMGYFEEMRKANPGLKIGISTNSFGSTDNLVAYAGNVRSRDRYVHQLGLEIGEYRPWPRDLRRALPSYDWLLGESRKENEASRRPPFVCIHAKSFVVDDDLAFIGSFNLDPRSAHLNTECGLLIADAGIAKALREEIKRDLHPKNCWVIAPRHSVDPLKELQMMSREITDWSPIDVAPFDATSAFELKEGSPLVNPEHPDFHRHFRDLGSFPGSEGLLREREIMGRLIKFSTPIIDPLL